MVEEAQEQQLIGLSSAMLADVQPELTATSVKYTLTASVIEQIFLQYPLVKQAYQDHVPDRLSETEFWTKYFQSRYYRATRDGIDQTANSLQETDDDLFSSYHEQDVAQRSSSSKASDSATGESSLSKHKAVIQVGHRGVDLTRNEAFDSYERQSYLLESTQQQDVSLSKQATRRQLLSKFNRHGEVVLDAGKLHAPQSSVDESGNLWEDLKVVSGEQVHQLRVKVRT